MTDILLIFLVMTDKTEVNTKKGDDLTCSKSAQGKLRWQL